MSGQAIARAVKLTYIKIIKTCIHIFRCQMTHWGIPGADSEYNTNGTSFNQYHGSRPVCRDDLALDMCYKPGSVAKNSSRSLDVELYPTFDGGYLGGQDSRRILVEIRLQYVCSAKKN